MPYRLTTITTKTGDDGYTNLGDKNRLPKNHPRIEVLGTLDELNSTIGLVLAHQPESEHVRAALMNIQQELFNIGGELCPPFHIVITAEKVDALTHLVEEWNTALPPLTEFILPGGNLASASCHLARTVCRRAERCVVTLLQDEKINPEILRYLNRLSDVLFVAARLLGHESFADEILWQHEKK